MPDSHLSTASAADCARPARSWAKPPCAGRWRASPRWHCRSKSNGIGMSEAELPSRTRSARSRVRAPRRSWTGSPAPREAEGSHLIGQFGVGFYSAFMVADKVEVVSRRAGSERGRILVVGRSRHLYHPAGRSAEARRRAARACCSTSNEEATGLYRRRFTIERTDQDPVRPCARADLPQEKAGRRAQADRRRRGTVDQAQEARSRRESLRISTAAPLASSTSPR